MEGGVFENFLQFIQSSEIHQTPGIARRYEYGYQPDDLPFNHERRPEVGEIRSEYRLEQMQGILDVMISKGIDQDPYILREIEKSYMHLREAYLRSTDKKRSRDGR
jgi:hypothetical protein